MNSGMNQKIVEQWERLRVILAATEDDVLKNARGNSSAGVRARKGLRELKREANLLTRLMIEEAKKRKEEEENE